MNHIADPMIFPALFTGAALFAIGLAGIMLRRSLIAVLMCIELMLTAVNLTLVTFSRLNQDMNGQLMVFFIVTVAAAEGAIGLGLLIALYRNLREVGTAQLNQMKN
ncbi:MAG: NADH-quinone oxidoreductase subunit NuoK [Bdellovibrionota bacterium]